MKKGKEPLQHILTNKKLNNFLKECRDKNKTSPHYVICKGFCIDYLEFSGVILPPKIAILKMKPTFTNASFMRSLDEIMEDTSRHHTVFIKKFAPILDSAFKKCARPSKEFFDTPEKEVEDILFKLLKELKSERKYINEAAFGFQWSLFFLFFILPTAMREKVGDLLVEINYNEIFNIVDQIGKVKPKDALECNDVYALTMVTLNTTAHYSSISKCFALYLANIGILTNLTVPITEAGYLNYLHEKPLSMMVNYVLVIVRNIAYHSDSKTKLKFEATKKALINFPKVNNNIRKPLTMLSLVYILDEHELGLLSYESNVINKIIRLMKKVLHKKKRVYTITLCQLADGLSKLTINSSNISKIVHTKGALSALVKMLRYENFKENASAVRCIHALAQDSTIRSTLLEFPDLHSALVNLREIWKVTLEKIIDDTLKTLQSCTPVLGAFAKPCLIAEISKPTENIALSHQVVKRGRSRNNSENVKRSRSHSGTAHKYVRRTRQFRNFDKWIKRSYLKFFITIHSAHVTNLVKQKEKFTVRGKSERLKPEDEKTIRRHWKYLIEEVDATHITTALISRGVFDLDDKREILGPDSRRKRTKIMLEKLLNAGPGSAYKTFIEVLEIDHSHIVDKLRK